MVDKAQAWRRWFGMLFLALAFGMLVWGQTVLRDELTGMAFLSYWATCFLLTFLAMMTALLDIWFIRRRQRAERRELLESTFRMDNDAAEEERGAK